MSKVLERIRSTCQREGMLWAAYRDALKEIERLEAELEEAHRYAEGLVEALKEKSDE